MSTTSKPKVIYIAGAGHSGTTLLDLALDVSPDTFSVGELKHLDQFLTDTNKKHTDDTGATANESRFWSWFYEQQDRYLPPARTEHVLSRLNRLHIILRGKPKTVPRRYVDNEQLYTDIQAQAAAVTGTKPVAIIDSSKVLSRLIELNERTDIELYVVHIVRDVRGVAYSYYKHDRPTASRVFEWLASNVGTARYARKNIPSERYLRVQYEEFAAQPEETLQYIAAEVGIRINAAKLMDTINETSSYRFGGNGMRQRQVSTITPDTRWHHSLPWLYKMALYPINRFIYSK